MAHVSRIGSGIQGIEEVEDLNSKTLTLNLHCNSLTSLHTLHRFPHLVEINLSDNRISTISGLDGLTLLTALNLASNRLQGCTGLTGLSSLKRLQLQFNAISSLTPLAELQRRAVGLEFLDLRGNCYQPVREYSVLSDLRHLKTLVVDHSHGSLHGSNRELALQAAHPWVSDHLTCFPLSVQNLQEARICLRLVNIAQQA